jgi:hypothetical protein
MRLGLERRSRAIFPKILKANYHSLSSSVAPSLLTLKRTFVTLQFARLMTQKSLNLVKE